MSEDLIGKQLGPYEIQDVLGAGAIATVYRGYVRAADRLVAVKVYPREFAEDGTFQSAFEDNVENFAQQKHPRILPVYEAGIAEGLPYLVMEYVEGGTVYNRIERGKKFSPIEAAAIVQQVADALTILHSNSIVHRNIKPQNIFLGKKGEVRLSDASLPSLRKAIMAYKKLPFAETSAYIAPELLESPPRISPAIDVYGLGISLFLMLTGELPFKGGETPQIQAQMHVAMPVPSLQGFNDNLSQDLEIVILQSLAKLPDDRFKTAQEMSAAFEKASGETKSSTRKLDKAHLVEQMAREKTAPEKPDLVKTGLDTTGPIPIEELGDIPGMAELRREIASTEGGTKQLSKDELQRAAAVADNNEDEEGAPQTKRLDIPTPEDISSDMGLSDTDTNMRQENKAAAKELKKEQREQKRQERRAARAARAIQLSWYTTVLLIMVLLLVWFVAGTMMGFEAREQVNAITLKDINIVQTQGAATATQIEAMTMVAIIEATNTQDANNIAGTATAFIPTEAVVIPDTPTPTPTLQPTATPIGGGFGRIALISNRDGDNEIFFLDLGTDELIKVTDNNDDDISPAWSPDGQWVAYSSTESLQGRHIFVMDANGENREEITAGQRVDRRPIWSPVIASGLKIAFFSSDGGRFYIRSTTLDGNEQNLLQLPVEVLPFDWSPDGQTLTAYGRSVDSQLEILAIDLLSGIRQPITDTVGLIDYIAYSPDRRKIVYTADLRGRSRLFIADAGCEMINDPECNRVQLFDDVYNYFTPKFSPDGSMILVTSDRFNNFDLFLIDLEGNLIEQVTESPFDEFDGVWQPVP